MEINRDLLKEIEAKKKKVLYPQNGCEKNCEKCKIEVANYNQGIDDAVKIIFSLAQSHGAKENE